MPTTYSPEIQFREYASRALITADSNRRSNTLVFNEDKREIDYLHEDGSTRTYISATTIYSANMATELFKAVDSHLESHSIHMLSGRGIQFAGDEGSWSSPELIIQQDTSYTPDAWKIRVVKAGDDFRLVTSSASIWLDSTDIRIKGHCGFVNIDEENSDTDFSVSASYGVTRWAPSSAPGGSVTATVPDGIFEGQIAIIANDNTQDASTLQLASSRGTDPVDGLSIAAGRVGVIFWFNDRWLPWIAWS